MSNSIAKGGNTMVTFIAEDIKRSCDKGGVTAGQTKYRKYFEGVVRQKLYGKYQDEVDVILGVDGYEECIVSF